MTGFIPFTNDDGVPMPTEYLPCSAITPKAGMCMALNAATGQLAASAKPQYICMMEAESAVPAGTVIPVIHISPKTRFQATLDAATTLKSGALADVTADGMQIDADGTTNKVFLLEEIEDATAGGIVRGRFVNSISTASA